ncbi:MAG: hypothetical protein EOO73_10805 [Myxococcales bacterium]|nr:MAG: hypothetical protein EOO73_10805 [Myxococcales bacterium]
MGPAAIGLVVGLIAHWGYRSRQLDSVAAPAVREAGELLTRYGQSLEAFALRAREFMDTPLKPRVNPELMLQPLSDAVKNMNRGYVDLEKRRSALMLDLHAAGNDKLACKLADTERFQWDDMRTKLNRLGLNLTILQYAPESAKAIASVQEDQRHGWPELCATLVTGARQFGDKEINVDCGAPP